MMFGSPYFCVLVISGIVTCAVSALHAKDLIDKKPSPTVIIVQAVLFAWFVFFSYLWIKNDKVGGGPEAIVFGVMIMFIGLLHAPIILFFAAKLFFGAVDGLTEPKSGVTIKKSYDEAEGAEADHDYEKALELYTAEQERDPEDGEVRLRIGNVLVKQGRFRVAAADFKDIVNTEMFGESVRLHAALRAADVYDKHFKDRQAAKEVLQRLLAEDISKEARDTLESRLATYS